MILLNFIYKKIGQNKVDMLLYKIIMLDFMTIKDTEKILRVDLGQIIFALKFVLFFLF